MSSDPRFKRQLMDEGIRRLDVDPLTPAGGVERDRDGTIRITDKYPLVARGEAQAALQAAERDTEAFLVWREADLQGKVHTAVHDLASHRRVEPTDSTLAVFLYQGPKQARERWEARRLELEAKILEAKEQVAAWEQSLATGGATQQALWDRFSQRAPDALTIKALTLSTERQRVERSGALRQYHWVEKVLESALGRSMQSAYAATREQLVARFSREKSPERLPERLQGQVARHREVEAQARELARERSRGHGMER